MQKVHLVGLFTEHVPDIPVFVKQWIKIWQELWKIIFTPQKQREPSVFFPPSAFRVFLFLCWIYSIVMFNIKFAKSRNYYFLRVVLSALLTDRSQHSRDCRIHFRKICYREVLRKFLTCTPKYVYITTNKCTITYHNNIYHNILFIY